MAEIMFEHIVERAIIMAAGIGQRLRPVTLTTPKPLVTVNGVCMIDTIIAALHENEIHEIYVVVGYLKEQFYEWAKKYNGITLIENPWYAECNNIASLYVAREYLNNAIILDGDQIIRNPAILHREFTRSGYSCAWTDRATNEWLLTVKNGIVTKCSHTGGDHGWQLFSVSRWTAEDGQRLRKHLELEFVQNENRSIYWDDVAMFCHPDEYHLSVVRGFLGDDFGLYYALLGVGIVGCTLYIAFSKFGKIKLGDCEKPQYRSFQWGTMIFTSTMAADILFYSLCEWALYANESQVEMMGGMQKWASTYPLFHWGPIAWGFYIVLAVAFGFMIHIRGRDKQKFSEACRPLLGSRVDGVLGRVIDLTAIFALIAGTATTFSLATPLLSRAISHVFGLQDSIGLTIAILLMIAAVYTFTVWFGMKGIAKLAAICSYCFFALLAYVLFGGGETRYILETGFSAIGNLVQNFIGLSTWMDPLRETSFPQNWTIYYWAYWMVWCVATPFFIGVISKGRTIRNTILGGYGWGLAGTFTSFIILGNYGLAQQLKHGLDITGFVAAGGDYSEAIMKIFDTLPLTEVGLILLAVTMIAFYSTTFDALTMVVSSYSYKRLKPEQEPDKRVRTFWAVVFILLPIALIFSENSMHSLQSVSIIAAFPIGIIILIIVASFFRDASGYLQERKDTQA